MKLIILLLLFIGNFDGLAAQANSDKNKLPKLKGDLTCYYKQKYSADQRGQFYPFSVADTIKLVSFHSHYDNYPVKGDSLVVDSLIEIKNLMQPEVDTLTDILYNNFYRSKPNYGTRTLCFSPQNAILFIDKKGQLKESVLIGFSCRMYETSSLKVNMGDNCREKMDKLRLFFISKGLLFGTDMNMELEGEKPEGIVVPPINN